MSAKEFISIDDDILTKVPIDNVNDIIQRHANKDSSDDDEWTRQPGGSLVFKIGVSRPRYPIPPKIHVHGPGACEMRRGETSSCWRSVQVWTGPYRSRHLKTLENYTIRPQIGLL
ncbi:hypothetical protein AVEN_52115-1 [Araneus ventricosus]|uniref:Uncharacterized protein n=1 Tax=Araneus ventricosus TaxID=182803 RepID=A0A4Y2E7B2_ARAVE|nr:hypothetical protein AVEN_52115-1 [Araneus ventricosus]